MKKRRKIIENKTPRDNLKYVDIRKTIKKKARQDIQKHNLDEIWNTIETSKSMNNVRRTDSLGKNWKKQFLMTNKAKASKSKITSSHGKKNYTQNYMTATKP